MGGRNQKTQLCLSTWAGGGDIFLNSAREALDPLGAKIFVRAASFVAFSETCGLFPTTPPKSRAFPGDLGVFADPNEAKAPEPSPNALEAPVVGEDMTLVEGARALKGLDLTCEELSPVYRFDNV
jgi:hypothetical protein